MGWSVLLQAVDQFSASGISQVIWLAFHADQDASLWDDLSSRDLIPDGLKRRSIQVQAKSLEQVQLLFREAALVIAMRLHALILAATAGCPTAALSYDPKVKAAAQLADLPWLDLNNQLNIDVLRHQWQMAIEAQRDGLKIENVKNASQLHQTMLVEQLNELSVYA
jgi:polysaccharide pyruvyl transferase WcaK-like protein